MSQIPQYPMDAWQASEYLFGQEALDADRSLASQAAWQAALQMEEAGWTFLEYNEYGDEVWEPPPNRDGSGN